MSLTAGEIATLKKFAYPDTLVEMLDEWAAENALTGQGAIQKRTVTIGFADFAALLAGVKTFDVNLGAALPANARLLAPPSLRTWTGFDDAAHGTYVAKVGTSVGGNEIATDQSVAAGQAGFPKIMSAGAAGFAGMVESAAQVHVRITSSVDLNTATAGAVTVDLLFTVLP